MVEERWLKERKLETEALLQFSLEMCLTNITPRQKAWAKTRCVPSDAELNRLGHASGLNLVERADNCEAKESSFGRSDASKCLAACGTYIGVYKSRKQAEEMETCKRITLQGQRINDRDSDEVAAPIDESGEVGQPADWFLQPGGYSGHGFLLPKHAYGEGRGGDHHLESARRAFDLARARTASLLKLFERALHPERSFLAQTLDEAGRLVLIMLNTPSSYNHTARSLILQRLTYQEKGQWHLRELAAASAASARARISSTQPLLAALATVDLLQEVFEDLAPADAASFLVAYVGSCTQRDPVTKQRIVDPLIVDAIKRRFPRLHIFSVLGNQHASERFPHHVALNGDGVIYKDVLLHIPIGFVTSRLRTRVRAEGRAEALARQQRLEGGFVERLPELDAKDVGDFTKDHGYRHQENALMQYEGHMTHPKSPIKRVKNNGWREREYVLDPDHQYYPSDALEYFTQAPKVRVMLVHAESRKPVISNHPHGGLEPQVELRAAKTEMVLCSPTGGPLRAQPMYDASGRNPRWKLCEKYMHPSAADRFGPRFEPPKTGGCQAICARFWAACLSTQHQNLKFRIVVECSGPQRTDPSRTLVITAETPPYTFQSDKNGGTRRKVSPAPSPSMGAGASKHARH